MKKKTITITASVAVINAIGFILVPISKQKAISQNIYLKTIKETVQFCLS